MASLYVGEWQADDGTPLAGDWGWPVTNPGKWGPVAPGTGAVVTWSEAVAPGYATAEVPSGGTIVPLSTFMPAGYKAQIAAALAAWALVANITFVEVVDNAVAFNGFGAVGDIRFGGHLFDGAGGALAHGYYPPANGVSAAGDIHFDTADLWKIGFGGPGFDIFQVAAHEIGHAIGLDHQPIPPIALMNPFYSEAFSGPQADDIAGSIFIYGVTQIPEPSTVVLLGLWLTGAAARRRRRARAA
jgi:hypothetical protein